MAPSENTGLIADLRKAVNDVLATEESVVLDDTPGALLLCCELEKILNNGLKGN